MIIIRPLLAPTGDLLADLDRTRVEYSGHWDARIDPSTRQTLMTLTDSRGHPSLSYRGRWGPLLGSDLEEEEGGGWRWRLAAARNEILFRARRALRQTLRRIGRLEAYAVLDAHIMAVEATRVADRLAIVRAIETSESVEDMIDRLRSA